MDEMLLQSLLVGVVVSATPIFFLTLPYAKKFLVNRRRKEEAKEVYIKRVDNVE